MPLAESDRCSRPRTRRCPGEACLARQHRLAHVRGVFGVKLVTLQTTFILTGRGKPPGGLHGRGGNRATPSTSCGAPIGGYPRMKSCGSRAMENVTLTMLSVRREASMEATICPRVRVWMTAFGCAVAAAADLARGEGRIDAGGDPTTGCPAIADKPDAVAPRRLRGVQHITYCYGPIDISPGQNIIQFRPAIDGTGGTSSGPRSRLHHPLRPRVRLRRRHGPAGRRPAPAPRRLGGQRRPAVRGRGGEDGPAAPARIRLAEPSQGLLDPQRHAARPGRPAGPGLRRLANRLRSRQLTRRRRDHSQCTPAGWTSPGTRASTRSSMPCDPMATTAPTRSRPGAAGGPPSVRRAGGEASWPRAPTAASERPRAGRRTTT